MWDEHFSPTRCAKSASPPKAVAVSETPCRGAGRALRSFLVRGVRARLSNGMDRSALLSPQRRGAGSIRFVRRDPRRGQTSAHDPHLGTQVPSLWYLAHMSAGDFDVIGATLPGAPAVAIGRNRFIAWGETNVAADVEDLYREHLDPSGTSAEFRGAYEPLRIIRETIQVSGGSRSSSRCGSLATDRSSLTPSMQTTRHRRATRSPAASSARVPLDRAEEEDNTSARFSSSITRATGVSSQRRSARLLVPSQNFVYDRRRRAYRLLRAWPDPIRAKGDGSIPAEGWTGEMEWTGWVPFDQLPHVYDPPEHLVITANQRPASPPYSHLITVDYPEPYRARRLHELIRGRDNLTPDDFRAMQADRHSLHARMLLPVLLQHVRPETTAARQAIDLRRRWNFESKDDAAAAILRRGSCASHRDSPVTNGSARVDSYDGRFSYITRFV